MSASVQLKVGMTVNLASGSPPLTVVAIDLVKNRAFVSWDFPIAGTDQSDTKVAWFAIPGLIAQPY